MKPFDVTQLGALYKADPVAYHLYCGMYAAHKRGDHKRRDEIREFTREGERQVVLDVVNGLDTGNTLK